MVHWICETRIQPGYYDYGGQVIGSESCYIREDCDVLEGVDE